MFDPYRKWLGIPEGERPPTHYQLLGIAPDERDREVIDAAVLRQSAYVRNFQAGKYSAEATRLLTEIAAAKLCLIDPLKRARYDAELRENGSSPSAAAKVVSPPLERGAASSPMQPRPAVQKSPSRPAAASAPAVRPQPAPRRTPASRTYSAGSLQPWAVEPPALGNYAHAPRAAADKRPIWIGLGVGACCVPFVLTALVLMSRPADPSVASADGQPGTSAAELTPVDVNPQAPPPTGSAAIPLVNPLVETAPPLVIVEGSTATADLNAGETQIAPAAGESQINENRAELSPQAPDGGQEFTDGTQREAERRRNQFESRNGRPSDFDNRVRKNSKEGVDTMFVGHDGGESRRTANPGSHLIGVAYRLGEWGREKCLTEIEPIFSLDETATLPLWETAREGYAVGAANVRTYNYVNAIRLTYMRIKEDGRLDPEDSYKGEWLGFRDGKVFEISGDGDPIIGIHARQGLILDAVALIVDRKSSRSKPRAKPVEESD